MKSRSINTIKNIVSGLISKLCNIIIPFVVRTVMLVYLGAEYVGLNSLFVSVLQVLNLAELGISSAITYCMYKPMAEGDIPTVCAFLNVIKRIYCCIGIFVGVIGIIIIPYLDKFVKGNYPSDISLVYIYLIHLINTMIGYFFFAYKGTILNASQQNGVISNVNALISFVQGIIQILIIVVFKSYYLYIIIVPIFTIFNNIYIHIITKKKFPQYIPYGNIDEKKVSDLKKRVKGLIVTRMCTTTRNSLDSIFISSFAGLTAVTIYGNYYYIMAAIISILNIVTTSMTASVGNSIATESVEKNYSDMRQFNFIFNWIVGFFSACLLCVYQPFMLLWVGEKMLYPTEMVVVFCVYFYILNIGSIRAVYHDATGLWWEARWRAILETILNVVLNLVLTVKYGAFGTVLGTLISLFFVNYLYGTSIVFNKYFNKKGLFRYFIDNGIYFLATVICSIFSLLGTQLINVNGLIGIFLKIGICTVIFNAIYYFIMRKNSICKLSIKKINHLFVKRSN